MIDPREELKAYLDNELASSEAEQVRRAIESDPALAQEADQFQAIAATLARESLIQPVGLEATLAEIRRQKVWWRRPSITWPAAVSVAGAIAMAVFLTVVLLPAGRVPGVRTASFAKSDQIEPDSSAAAGDTASKSMMAKSSTRQFKESAGPLQDNGLGAVTGAEPTASIDLHDRAEANRLLNQLTKLPGFVSVHLSAPTSQSKSTVRLVYRDQKAMETAKTRARRFAGQSRSSNFGSGYEITFTFETARK